MVLDNFNNDLDHLDWHILLVKVCLLFCLAFMVKQLLLLKELDGLQESELVLR